MPAGAAVDPELRKLIVGSDGCQKGSCAILFISPDEVVVAGRDEYSTTRITKNHYVRDAKGAWTSLNENSTWPDNGADLGVAPVEVRSKTYRQLFVDGKRVGPPFE